jgi:two-component system, OmpR family, sensor histidine kinase SenX3
VGDGLLLVGVGAVALLVGLLWGRRSSSRPGRGGGAAPAGADDLDDGVAAVLAVLRSAAVVTTRNATVVRSSAVAHTTGLVRDDRIVHDVLTSLVLDVARDGRERDLEVELPRGPLGGTPLQLHVRVAPLGERHLLLLAEDRTEARRLEAVRRDFVVNVSHELKTPVGALSLLAETVEDAADDPEAVRRFAGRMQVEATRLSALVHEIIQLSRLQGSEPLTDAEPVVVADVLAEAVDRAGTSAAAKGIVLEVGPVPDVSVLGNHDLLVTAVRNLLDNAVSYSEPGTRVAVGTAHRSQSGRVEISVVDQGIGIPAEALARLFERFYRVDPARSRDTGGTGLGLSIVKHVAAEHGGDVAVWSQPGQGSTFTLRLPVAPAPGGAAGPDDVTSAHPSEGAAR